MGKIFWLVAVVAGFAVAIQIESLVSPRLGVYTGIASLASFAGIMWAAAAIEKRLTKPATALDAVNKIAFGDTSAVERCDLQMATELADDLLLQSKAPQAEVQQHAAALYKGPMSYSTHELAAATALNFFRSQEHHEALVTAQLSARKLVSKWAIENKVSRMLAEAFETTVRRRYQEGERDRFKQNRIIDGVQDMVAMRVWTEEMDQIGRLKGVCEQAGLALPHSELWLAAIAVTQSLMASVRARDNSELLHREQDVSARATSFFDALERLLEMGDEKALDLSDLGRPAGALVSVLQARGLME